MSPRTPESFVAPHRTGTSRSAMPAAVNSSTKIAATSDARFAAHCRLVSPTAAPWSTVYCHASLKLSLPLFHSSLPYSTMQRRGVPRQVSPIVASFAALRTQPSVALAGTQTHGSALTSWARSKSGASGHPIPFTLHSANSGSSQRSVTSEPLMRWASMNRRVPALSLRRRSRYSFVHTCCAACSNV